jgi:hypothetical protein
MNSETNLAVKTSQLTRETTQVDPAAKENKPRAKAGRDTQTNSTLGHQAGKSGETVKSSRLGITPNAAQQKVF